MNQARKTNGSSNRLFSASHPKTELEMGPGFVPPIRTFYQSPTHYSSTNLRKFENEEEHYYYNNYSSDHHLDSGYFSNSSMQRNQSENVSNLTPSVRRPQMSRRKILSYLFEKSPTNDETENCLAVASPVRVRKNAIFSRTDVVRTLVREEISNNLGRKKNDKKTENVCEKNSGKFIETLGPKINTKLHKMLSNIRAKCSIVIFSMPQGRYKLKKNCFSM